VHTEVRSPVNVDAFTQAVTGLRLASRVHAARSVWVVATVASAGWAAQRSRRPYACWIGTALEDEWAGRRRGLSRSRRAARAVNAPVLRRLERSVLRGAAGVYAVSPAGAAAVAAAGGLHDVRVLPIPVDVERFAPEPDEIWLARQGAPTVVFVGRADDPRKNVNLLLRAFAGLRRELPQATLRLIGRPPARPTPAGVDVLGVVPSLADELRSATILVLPSWQEGFGIVVAEALASGVPVVTTPSGGPEHLVTSSGGGVVLSSFDDEELTAALAELLGDVARLRAMRVRGREHVVREHSQTRFQELLAPALAELDSA
jgi:glycosyltransferase involved in cell wall biosynthesis